MMKKSLFMAAMAVFALSPLRAQTNSVRPIEFEMHVGATTPIGGMHDTDKKVGPALGVEMRYNFKNSPFDVGFAIDLTTARYGWKPDEYDRSQSNRTAFLGFTGDYNFRQGGKVNPFVGMGLGIGIHDALVDVIEETNDQTTSFPTISPRVGVELWRHLRLTLVANITCKYYNNVGINVGYVIGGGQKK